MIKKLMTVSKEIRLNIFLNIHYAELFPIFLESSSNFLNSKAKAALAALAALQIFFVYGR